MELEAFKLAKIFDNSASEAIAQTEQLELQGQVILLMKGVGQQRALSADLFSSELLHNLGSWLRRMKERSEEEPDEANAGKLLEYFRKYQRIIDNF